jgi:hypothetical protein
MTATDPNLSLKPEDQCIFAEARMPLSLSSIFLSFLAQFNFGLTASSRHVVKISNRFENISIATWSSSMKRLLILAALAVMLGGVVPQPWSGEPPRLSLQDSPAHQTERGTPPATLPPQLAIKPPACSSTPQRPVSKTLL